MIAIPRTRASVVCLHDGRLLTVRATDPVTRRSYLFLPGGAVEPGESPAAAAARETLEESGYHVTVNPSSELALDYDFHWSGQDYACRTHFYRAELTDPQAPPVDVSDDDYLHGVEWLPLDRLDETFAYHDAIRRAVAALAQDAAAARRPVEPAAG